MKSKEWITKNFEFLVAKYGGKQIGVIDEQVISVALTPREVLENAKKLGKEAEAVSLLKVPMEEELICVLQNLNTSSTGAEMCLSFQLVLGQEENRGKFGHEGTGGRVRNEDRLFAKTN